MNSQLRKEVRAKGLQMMRDALDGKRNVQRRLMDKHPEYEALVRAWIEEQEGRKEMDAQDQLSEHVHVDHLAQFTDCRIANNH